MILAAILLAATQTAPLQKLIERCDASARPGVCQSDLFKPVWRKFVDSQGYVVYLDTASVEPATMRGGATAWVYFANGTRNFDMGRAHMISFDCEGQWRSMDHSWPEPMPPAIMGRVAATACAIAAPKLAAIRKQRGY